MEQLTREIIIIPATIKRGEGSTQERQLRVASYSRVSTDFEEQLSSFHAQKAYYNDMILKNPKWTLVGNYADEGISGADAKKRPDFMRMIRHCKKGKIDLIITKSVSRFARNTKDAIEYVRLLKVLNVGVLFEKEGINTLEESSELFLTLMFSLAQEELNSLSLNVKMGIRMAMKEGHVTFNFNQMYGFKKGVDGQPEVIPSEAKVVQHIYSRYLLGDSVRKIIIGLHSQNIFDQQGKKWTDRRIRTILTHERYCTLKGINSDKILQKTYITAPVNLKNSKKVRGLTLSQRARGAHGGNWFPL